MAPEVQCVPFGASLHEAECPKPQVPSRLVRGGVVPDDAVQPDVEAAPQKLDPQSRRPRPAIEVVAEPLWHFVTDIGGATAGVLHEVPQQAGPAAVEVSG
jgi:hypothetical protein